MKCCHDVSIIVINKYLHILGPLGIHEQGCNIYNYANWTPSRLYFFCCILMQNCSYKHLLRIFVNLSATKEIKCLFMGIIHTNFEVY